MADEDLTASPAKPVIPLTSYTVILYGYDQTSPYNGWYQSFGIQADSLNKDTLAAEQARRMLEPFAGEPKVKGLDLYEEVGQLPSGTMPVTNPGARIYRGEFNNDATMSFAAKDAAAPFDAAVMNTPPADTV